MVFQKGMVPWNKEIIGYKTKPCSEERKQKISIANKGKAPWCKGKKIGPYSEEHCKKLSESHKGKHPTKETRAKMSSAQKGKIPWNTGMIGYKIKPCSEETKKLLRAINLGKKMPEEQKQKLRGRVLQNVGLRGRESSIPFRVEMNRTP